MSSGRRRCKIFTIPRDLGTIPVRFLINALDALPPGSEIRALFNDFNRGESCLVVWNSEFKEFGEGFEYPRERFIQSPNGNFYMSENGHD